MEKGQTALEYLITYGWAILVILVVLAVLWYYGIFNPATWAGTQVISGNQFQILDHSLTTTSLDIVIGNKGSDTLQVTAIAVSGDVAFTGAITPKNLTGGGNTTFSVTLDTALTSGATVTYTIGFTYDNVRTGLTGKSDSAEVRNEKVP